MNSYSAPNLLNHPSSTRPSKFPQYSSLATFIDWCCAAAFVAFIASRHSQAIRKLLVQAGNDFEWHVNDIARGITTKHSFFHYFTFWVAKLLNLNIFDAAYVVLLFNVGLAALFTFFLLRAYLNGVVSLPVTICLTASLMHIAGLWAPTIHYQRSLGIGNPNVLHSPTTLTVKPIALLVILSFYYAIISPNNWRALVMSMASAVLAVLSVLAKPNFVLAFIVAAPISCVILLLGRKIERTRVIILSIPVLACLGMLYFQWSAQYGAATDGSSVEYAPLLLASHFHPSPWISILQLSAFPLAVIIWRPRVFQNIPFLVAFTTFSVSVLEYLLLAETGERRFAGNFGWGRDIASSILFPCALGFAVREGALRHSLRPAVFALILPALYFWHFWSGIEYFDHVIRAGQEFGESQQCIKYR